MHLISGGKPFGFASCHITSLRRNLSLALYHPETSLNHTSASLPVLFSGNTTNEYPKLLRANALYQKELDIVRDRVKTYLKD